GPHVGDLVGECAHTIRGSKRCDLDRAEHADCPARSVQESTAAVTRDAGRGGVDVVAPAAALLLYDDAWRGGERRDATPELGVAVGVDLRSGGAPGADPGRPAER